ncbi:MULTISPECIES: hypothetical protein [unclassified Prochlorococcus]|uniref:hypothetical protein n=1 Tax=unclassified Prochlorococcus TaxID=2627481 RepID=UPI00056D2B29|nr:MULTISPECIES: hypothetical protein [unclassified Prochlorococcus]
MFNQKEDDGNKGKLQSKQKQSHAMIHFLDTNQLLKSRTTVPQKALLLLDESSMQDAFRTLAIKTPQSNKNMA